MLFLNLFYHFYLFAVILSLPIIAIIGYAFEIFLARPLYARDHLDHVLGTFGAILVIDTIAHLIWGPAGIAIPLPKLLRWANHDLRKY